MCIGCAMVGASAATGFRTWLQARGGPRLTPRLLRALTIAAVCAAAAIASVGFGGATPPNGHPVAAGHAPLAPAAAPAR